MWYCDLVMIINHEMESLEEIPDLDLKISLETKTEIKFQNFTEESTDESSEQESECKNNIEAFEFCWQDFVPVCLNSSFLFGQTNIPSLLSLVSDVSDLLPDGALFFNFCFDWWFTEPLHPDEDSVKTVELKFPCTRCEKKFQFDWQVSQHYLESHQVSQLENKPPPEKEVKEPPPEPAPEKQVKEPTPEVYVEPYPLLEDWKWEDFLPDWNQPFLPHSDFIDYPESDIEDDCPTPPPSPPPSPPPASPPPPPPPILARPSVLDIRLPATLAPVIKQSKFLCRTCEKIICNSCFSKKCGVHNVEFKGTATFACSLC